MKKVKEYFRNFSLTMLLTVCIFLAIATILSLTAGIMAYAIYKQWIPMEALLTPLAFSMSLYGICMILAVVIVFMVRKLLLRPIQDMIADMKKLASGDFSVQIEKGKGFRPREIREFQNAFNKTAQELNSVELLRKDFINNFAHEFKTPITSIGGFADLLLENTDMSEQEREECLRIIGKESRRLAVLSSNILTLNKVESQTLLSECASYSLSEQLRQTVLLLEQKWSAKGLKLELDLEECSIYGNEALLKQVWMNLLDNAIKFSKENECIKITLQCKDEMVEAAIKDYGIGMSEETQAHIFEQFYQGDTSHQTEGNGLGLALAKRIVELHKGTISVCSQLNEGSEFMVSLPLV